METDAPIEYTRFACIGAGASGIGLGATLKRWYGGRDGVDLSLRIFERGSACGGTWQINAYPGAACDIPSALYSLSYESNPDWSRVLPPARELRDYLVRVAAKYDLPRHMQFGIEAKRCEWRERDKRWRLTLQEVETGRVFYHECQFLFSGVGLLVNPRDLDIPGAETFSGSILHSARWSHDGQRNPDVKDKKVIVIGNGCSGTQIVPAIAPKTRHLTHMIRSKHWICPHIDKATVPLMRFMLRWVPFAMFIQRVLLYVSFEGFVKGYPLTPGGQKFRDWQRETITKYMKSTAPEKYHDLLIPDFEVGCKRRIFNAGYLESLHADNVTLTDEKGLEIVPSGVRTAKGIIEADVIIVANGFRTNSPLHGMEVIGRDGETMDEHWGSFGGPEAYNCTVLNGFPNFFMLLGPNTVNGHSSSIIASENSVNYSLRLIRPLLNEGPRSTVEVHRDAEEEYVQQIQAALKQTVWSLGCGNWYARKHGKGGEGEWNASTYPWNQAYFWYSCLFPTWKHLTYEVSIPFHTSSGRELATLTHRDRNHQRRMSKTAGLLGMRTSWRWALAWWLRVSSRGGASWARRGGCRCTTLT